MATILDLTWKNASLNNASRYLVSYDMDELLALFNAKNGGKEVIYTRGMLLCAMDENNEMVVGAILGEMKRLDDVGSKVVERGRKKGDGRWNREGALKGLQGEEMGVS